MKILPYFLFLFAVASAKVNKELYRKLYNNLFSYDVTLSSNTSYTPLPTKNITLQTSLGTIVGTHVNLGGSKKTKFYGIADVFLSVPFVHPPIGDYRFKHSVPITTFPNNPQIAQQQPPMCPQSFKDTNFTMSDGQSEDCLYINIFSPNVKTTEKFPVFVLIPGGGFISGSISEWGYKGLITNFVSNDIVVVVVQYRLGIPGFFTTFTNDIPPNRGLYDQTNALKFVKKHISEFGGDPNKITLAGHSSGSVSVEAQLLSPLTKGLFQQIMIMSGQINLEFAGSMPNIEVDSNFLVAKDLCNVTQDQWNKLPMDSINACIKKIPIQKLVEYQVTKFYEWTLVVDKDFIGFLPDAPSNLYNNITLMPTVMGSTNKEVGRGIIIIYDYIKSFLNEQGYKLIIELLSQVYTTDDTDTFAQLLYNFNVPLGVNSTDSYEWTEIFTDTVSGLGIYNFIARDASKFVGLGNKNVYMYQNSFTFNYCPTIFIDGKRFQPLSHADDFFGLTMRPEFFDSPSTTLNDTDIEIAHRLGTYWSMFVRNETTLNGLDYPWKAITDPNNLSYISIRSKSEGDIIENHYHKDQQQLYENAISVVLGQWPLEDGTSKNNNGR
uniref:Carboxylic ester hydrolase n=1 Tax=Parastrongyloides trichosuri TaxID=131310 RepID=A0A0N4Z333_PARTI